MKMKLQGLWAVVMREVNYAIHDTDILIIALVMPMFYAFFYGSLYLQKGEHDVAVVVVDLDHSATSKTLIRQLDAHPFIHITDEVPDLGTAQERLEKFDAQGVIFIPPRFESSLKSGKGGDIKLYLNTTRFLVSNDINKGVNEVVQTAAAGIRVRYFQMQGYSFKQAMELMEPLHAEIKPMFNTTETYGDFLIPAILALILQQTLLMAIAETFAKERETKTLGTLFTLSNKSTWGVINGKSTFYFILFAAYSLFFFSVNFSIFKIPFRGNPCTLIALTILFLFAVIYFSVFIASFFKRKIIALQVLAFTSYPIFLSSGYSWPMQAMPLPLQALAQFYPITPFLAGYTRIAQMGAGWGDVTKELLHLLILVGVGFIASHWRMKVVIQKEMH
jgi:ABC-2 type transport system permease protein